MKDKALILGISGQDGTYLAKLLLEKGYEVHGTSRDHEASSFSNLERLGIKKHIHFHSAVPSDFRSIFSVIDRVRPHELYNLGGQTSVGLSFVVPVETFESISVGTLNVLECLRMLKLDIKFYSAGSGEAFGNTPEGAREDTLFQPRSPYGTAKAAAHYFVANYREAYQIFCCSGILFNHESPLRPMRFVTKKIVSTVAKIKNGSKEKLELGRMDIQRDWGWAPEYVEAMWLMLQQQTPDDYVIATGICTSLQDYTSQAFAYAGLDWREYVTLNSALKRPTDIDVSFGSAAKAAKVLGWKPKIQLPEIIARMVEHEFGAKLE